MNLKVRFRNKKWVITFLGMLVAIVFKVINDFNIIVPLSENEVLGYITDVCMLLGMLGVFIDPTTDGITDSSQAMEYDEPRKG